jgi:hypothetical protein
MYAAVPGSTPDPHIDMEALAFIATGLITTTHTGPSTGVPYGTRGDTS